MGRKKIDPALTAARGGFRKNPQRAPVAAAPKLGPRKKRTIQNRPYAEIIEQYVRDVIERRVVACKWLRHACQRHADDCAREPEARYPYHFDSKAAAAVLSRMGRYPHIKGRWAKGSERIVLGPWQCFLIGVLFGWKRKTDGTRRFRSLYWEIPRKNSKSTMAALIGLEMLACDNEHGAEIYAGATTEKQAHEVFGPAKLMLERSPEIRDELGAEVWAKAIVLPADNSRFWPIIGRPGDGSSPSCAIVDEYHEHPTSELLDTMVSGMGSREQPLLAVITTAGSYLASPCRDMHLQAEKVLEGTLVDDEFFAVIYIHR